MDTARKTRMFLKLVELGFKEIEIGLVAYRDYIGKTDPFCQTPVNYCINNRTAL
jgi:hypothetical protein